MQTLIERNFTTVVVFSGIAAIIMIANFPVLSFFLTMGIWMTIRAPRELNRDSKNCSSCADTWSEALYEALWAAVLVVFGVSAFLELLGASGGVACPTRYCG